MSVQKVLEASSQAPRKIQFGSDPDIAIHTGSSHVHTGKLSLRELYDKGKVLVIVKRGRNNNGSQAILTKIGKQIYLTDTRGNMLYGSFNEQRVERKSQQLHITWLS